MGILNSDKKPDPRWILIAEDDDDIRQILKDSISMGAPDPSALHFVEVKDGAEALSQTSQRQFHCVVTDLKMPKSTGDEFIRAMQTQALNNGTPTLVVSAHSQDEFRDFCDQYAHIKVIQKPFDPNVLAQAVHQEIKLGRMDDRIAIHLMNPFLDGLREFMSKDLGISGEIGAPEVKKSGQALMGDFHCTITLSTGVSRGRFTFSFDRTLLEWAKVNYYKTRVSELASLTHDDIARYMIQSTFDRAASQIQICMGGTPRLAGLSIITPRNPADAADLALTTGVTVKVSTDHGRAVAGAFSRPKTKRI